MAHISLKKKALQGKKQPRLGNILLDRTTETAMNPNSPETVKILIVDDEALLGNYMGASLSQFGFKTVSVTSGKGCT